MAKAQEVQLPAHSKVLHDLAVCRDASDAVAGRDNYDFHGAALWTPSWCCIADKDRCLYHCSKRAPLLQATV